MSTREIVLDGGSPWGFRMHGGADVGQPLRISRVNPGSKAALKGIREGDVISSINGQPTRSVSNSDAHALLRNAGQTLHLGLNEECSGSPKRRIHRNAQQESKSEPVKRLTVTKTTTATARTTPVNGATDPNSNSQLSDKGDLKDGQNGGVKETSTGFASDSKGIWSPSLKSSTDVTEDSSTKKNQEKKAGEDAPPVVWTPKSAGASPTSERKEFRPVNFESPTLSRKTRSVTSTPASFNPADDFQPSVITSPVAQESTTTTTFSSIFPPWHQQQPRDDSILSVGSTLQSPTSDKSVASSTIASTLDRRLVQSQSAPASGLSALASGGYSSIKLPRAQNPTITLLQKAREGQLPRGALYLDHKMNSKEAERLHASPNEIMYTVKKEYESEGENEQRKKIVELGPRKYEGIGPMTKEGIPIVLRSEVKDANQAKWYKRMYDSLHRAGKDGHYPYTSPGGYLSEPEPALYDSDIGYSAKYATLDRRRIKNKENDFTTSTLPRSRYVPHPASIKYATEVYKNQPGRIEDYEPGHSSISEKETKQWWDEVLDIFDGQTDAEPRTTPSTPSNKPFMTYALKESGYESDSTLVFKRRDENLQNQLSPAEQKLAYKTIQKGGEVPLHGLRKPAPERPKGHYPYTSPGGYLSEPEPALYDSDIGYSAKYATLDRRRIKNKENDFTTSTLPRSRYVPHPASIKYATEVYKNQPGRIEDYEPGHSSISEKETKQWWDEVLDIFDGQTDAEPRTTPSTPSNKPFMTYALKESGYESDSTLVFKRRDENLQNQLSPAEQKLAYKTIQKGGEVPLHGLRKPAPERPKESPHRYVESEVTIHYRSPVRSEAKEALSEEELARRQAEAMRRIYQEERRRKYLQELQDMHSRRHTDNFTPSQKSPIPLNRYDDFLDGVGNKGKPRDRTPEPKLVARALYNFVGQTSRELSFRRGDIIFVRRQIDKNWYEGEHNAMIGLFPFNYVEIIPYDGIRTIPKRPNEGQARAKFNFFAQTHLELSLVKGELVVLTRRVDDNWFEGRIGNRKGIFPVSYVEVLSEPGEKPVTPVTPTSKPITLPASHTVLMNGSGIRQSMGQHSYQPSSYYSQNKMTSSYTSSNPYATLPRQSQTLKQQLAPVNQTLHIDTHSEPVPYRALYNYRPQNEDELELCEGDTVYVMEKCDDGWYVGSSQRTGYFGTFPGNYVERI